MRALHILDRYGDGVRRQRATLDEIRDIVSKRNPDRLARVDLDSDGEIVVTPLTDAELSAIAEQLDAELVARVGDLLDHAVTFARKAAGLSGVQLGSLGAVTFWLEGAPHLEAAVLAWAEERGCEVKRSSPPRDRKSWYPDADLRIDGIYIARMIWPEVEINTERVTEEEIAKVKSERELAERELGAF